MSIWDTRILFLSIFVNLRDIILIFSSFLDRLHAQQSRVCISLSGEKLGNGGGAQFRKADFNSVSFYTEKEISSTVLFEGRTATWDYENRVDGAENTCENPKSWRFCPLHRSFLSSSFDIFFPLPLSLSIKILVSLSLSQCNELFILCYVESLMHVFISRLGIQKLRNFIIGCSIIFEYNRLIELNKFLYRYILFYFIYQQINFHKMNFVQQNFFYTFTTIRI